MLPRMRPSLARVYTEVTKGWKVKVSGVARWPLRMCIRVERLALYIIETVQTSCARSSIGWSIVESG